MRSSSIGRVALKGLIAFTLGLLVPGQGLTKVIYVDRNVVNPSHDGTSWATSFFTIQSALNQASAGDEVWVAASRPPGPGYVENIVLKDGVSLYGGFWGSELQREDRDWKANLTIIDGNGSGSVVSIPSTSTAQVVLDGFTVRNGAVQNGYGGGINAEGPAIISHNTITENSAFAGGGVNASSIVIITDNTISMNQSELGPSAVRGIGSGVIIKCNTITSNISKGDSGAVIVAGGRLSGNMISDNYVIGNWISEGGAIKAFTGSVIEGNTIVRNKAKHAGGIVSSGAVISRNIITDNVAEYSLAGGISAGDNTTIVNNVIMRNRSGSAGGGIDVMGNVMIRGNLIAENTTGYEGAGIRVQSGEATIVNNTIAGNRNEWQGGGLFLVGDKAVVINCIIANNSSGVYSLMKSTDLVFSHNDVSGNLQDYQMLPDQTGISGNINTDPGFVHYGLSNYRLRSDSTCIGKGDGSVVLPGEVDLEGNPRILGQQVDIGAYEYGDVPPPLIPSALSIAGGLTAATPERMDALGVADCACIVDIAFAVRLARKAAGLEGKP